MTSRLALPARLDSAAAAELTETLRAQEEGDLVLDAAETVQIGTLSVQAILVAAQSWERAGHSLRVENLAPERQSDLALLGLADHPVFAGEAAE